MNVMFLNDSEKQRIKEGLLTCLSGQEEIRKLVVFGSFLTSPSPNDLDLAIFQDSDETYLPLAMKYRLLLRPITRHIAIDVIPLRNSPGGWLLQEINKGEVIYES